MNRARVKAPVLSVVAFLLFPVFSVAGVFEVKESLPLNIESPRWMYSEKEFAPKTGVLGGLWRIKFARQSEDWGRCLKEIDRNQPRAQGLKKWLIYSELQCLTKVNLEKAGRGTRLRKVLSAIEGDAGIYEFFSGSELTNSAYLKASFHLLEREVKVSRSRAWRRVNRIQKFHGRLDKKQKAKLYRMAGNLAFVEQNLVGAWDFYQRSLKFDASTDLQKKAELIKKTLKLSDEKAPQVVFAGKDNPEALFSKAELKLVDQMKEALRSKDYVSAAQDGVELIKSYPGSEWADWASDQVLKVYLGVVNKSDKRFNTVRKKVLRTMKSADGKRLYRWARNAWAKGAYRDVVALSSEALDKIKPHPDERKILLLAANASVSSGDYSSAKEFYIRLTKRFAGTNQAVEGRFRLGLLYFRERDYSRAASQFEKLLANASSEDYRSEALYWNWRSYQKAKRNGSEALSKSLIQEFPLTYYGLRARAETNGGQLIWSDEEKSDLKLSVSMALTEFENQSRERFLLLLRAGWLKEARVELESWPAPVSAKQKLMYANFWAASLDHFHSIKLINEAWNEDTRLRTKAFVRMAFPKEFSEFVASSSERFSITPSIVYALIRQESSFRPEVKSPANASGLMQIMPMTAKDIARYLRWKKPLKIPQDLLKPDQNVTFGTSYLKRMARAFDGHLPLALAAYNAGIGRMRRWLNSRTDFGVDEKVLKSDPASEIWIDELPWSETRFYVKSILRNYIIYQWLEEDSFELPDPVWRLK